MLSTVGFSSQRLNSITGCSTLAPCSSGLNGVVAHLCEGGACEGSMEWLQERPTAEKPSFSPGSAGAGMARQAGCPVKAIIDNLLQATGRQ